MANTPAIRVLFACPGWPSGIIDVASWAAAAGLARPIVFQLQPGRICRLEDDDGASLAGAGVAAEPLDAELHEAFVRRGRRLSADARVRLLSPGRAWLIEEPEARRRYRLEWAGGGFDVFDPDQLAGPAVDAAIRGRIEQTGDVGRYVDSTGAATAEVRAALAAVGGDYLRRLVDFRPHLVGFRLEAGGLDEVCGYVAATRLFCDAQIVLGGPTATSHPRESLVDCDVDYVFAGEAEETFNQFLRLAAGRNSIDRAAEIPGLTYRYAGTVYHNTLPSDGYERSALETDPAACGLTIECVRNAVRPLADRATVAANRLDWSLLENFRRESESLFFTGGRGCPGACTFCAKLHGQEVRAKSARQVLDEIAAADAKVADRTLPIGRWPLFQYTLDAGLRAKIVGWAAIYDEDFFLHRRRAIEFFRLWDRSPLKDRYRISVQTNPCSMLTSRGEAHGELLKWIDRLKPMVQLGAESFNEDVLRRWHKRHSPRQLDTALDALDATGQDYTVFQLLTDFDTTAAELIESLRLMILAALRRPRMRVAHNPFTIPLYDSQTRKELEYRDRLIGRVRHFTEYERPQPGWMDPLVVELADAADAELQWCLVPEQRDAALMRAMEAVAERLHEAAAATPADRLVAELCDQAARALNAVKDALYRRAV